MDGMYHIIIIINHFIHSHMHKSSYDNGIEDIKLYVHVYSSYYRLKFHKAP